MITGGAGFIGSHVADEYIKAGHKVIVVDNLSTGRRSNIERATTFYEVDIRSPKMDMIFKKERPDIVNHHAAQVSVPRSVAEPIVDEDINVKGLLNILEKAVKNKVKKIIFISSGGAIYGEASEYPTSEGCVPKPHSPYAISKTASELYIAYYKQMYELDYCILRYANIYGPRQISQGEAGVISIFINNLLNNQESILNHFPNEPAGMVRDYCFVSDVVAANLLALKPGESDIFNIGTGKGTNTLQLYDYIFGAIKESVPNINEALAVPKRALARPGDIRRSCLNIEKAKNVLNWEPTVDIKNGIRLTLKWWLKR